MAGYKAQPLQPNSKGVSKGANPNTFWSPGQSASTGKGGTKVFNAPPKGKTPTASSANTPKSPSAKAPTKRVGGGKAGKGIKIPGL